MVRRQVIYKCLQTGAKLKGVLECSSPPPPPSMQTPTFSRDEPARYYLHNNMHMDGILNKVAIWPFSRPNFSSLHIS